MELSVFTTSTTEAEISHNARMFPNPTDGRVYIENRSKGALNHVYVLNALGQTVFSSNEKINASERAELDLSGLPAGAYMVRLGYEGEKSEVYSLILK